MDGTPDSRRIPTDRVSFHSMRQRVFSFPDQVDERAARTVAAGVLAVAVVTVAFRVPWLVLPLAYGFWARLLTGPTLSPLAQLATRVVLPRLGSSPRPTPGPPKRFAQGLGAFVTTSTLLVWAAAGWGVARWLIVALTVPAFLESAVGYCVGCAIFTQLIRLGIVPATACPECADLSRRHPTLARNS